ncbi:hypothetical protein ACFVS2_25230 [Brevibacillus sp. NPDC058079]|uniref:hypothetical protein n=1 Tax=Brevibacillus sp. NPDC058079 TaxID=3346330 RepID=UPI0036E421F7
MKIFRVLTCLSKFQEQAMFEITVYEMNAKETKTGYTWTGKILLKDELGVVTQAFSGESNIGFHMYVREEDVQEAKVKTTSALTDYVEKQLDSFQTYKEMLRSFPAEKYEVLEEDGIWKTVRSVNTRNEKERTYQLQIHLRNGTVYENCQVSFAGGERDLISILNSNDRRIEVTTEDGMFDVKTEQIRFWKCL